jgi:hypothetical protein
MARTYVGAFVEMFKREIASKFHKDLVLQLETAAASQADLTKVFEELRREFPSISTISAGGDPDLYWKISVVVRPKGATEWLRQDLARWASRNEPWVRSYSIYQRSLWTRRRRST